MRKKDWLNARYELEKMLIAHSGVVTVDQKKAVKLFLDEFERLMQEVK